MADLNRLRSMVLVLEKLITAVVQGYICGKISWRSDH